MKIMLKAIAEASKNMKTGSRTDDSMKALINAYNAASRTPSRSPEQVGRGNSSSGSGKGSSSGAGRSRAEIFAAFGLAVPDAPAGEVLCKEAAVLAEGPDLECHVISDASASDADDVRSCSAKECRPYKTL